MTVDEVRGEKPSPQWQMAAVHHRASRHGGLPCAARTFPSARFCFKGQPLQAPQEGQTKPFGHLRSAKYCSHASSLENRTSNAWRELGLLFFHLADISGTIEERRRLSSRIANIMCRRTKGDKPFPPDCRSAAHQQKSDHLKVRLAPILLQNLTGFLAVKVLMSFVDHNFLRPEGRGCCT